jgi:hypothetical protein
MQEWNVLKEHASSFCDSGQNGMDITTKRAGMLKLFNVMRSFMNQLDQTPVRDLKFHTNVDLFMHMSLSETFCFMTWPRDVIYNSQVARQFKRTVEMEPFLKQGNKKVEDFLKLYDAERRSVLSRYQGSLPIINCTVGGGVNCYGVADIIKRALKPKPGDNLRALEMPHSSFTQVPVRQVAQETEP